MPIQKPFARVK